MELTGKNVLVMGAGISGRAAVELLLRAQANPLLFEGNTEKTKEDIIQQHHALAHVPVYIGEVPEEILIQVDLAILSPGIPPQSELPGRCRELNIPLWGELELAYRLTKGEVFAITGTNGKTTTTALTGEIFKAYFSEVFVVGNIGIPYTSVAIDTTQDSRTVIEVSSFQLETVREFRPRVSAILNITEDHMDRHHTMQEYARVKELITQNQTAADVCVLNYEDEELRRFSENLIPRCVFFSSARSLEEGVFLHGDDIVFREQGEETLLVNVNELHLLGKHNYENVMAAFAIAYSTGIPVSVIRRAILKFIAVPHRIEFVREVNEVMYYNDSKGTNPDAAIKAVQAMKRPTLIIGGGYDKNADFKPWITAFGDKVRLLVLLGQTKEKIREAAEEVGFSDFVMAETLEEAVGICAAQARPGDAVLLSPACASWGQFTNYEERGDRFKEYVGKIQTH
ncbi:MAG: UDP-N-acetylmuramoyl-L-alanine--D-glutamate ligase [Lachnospiraceae bacterium]